MKKALILFLIFAVLGLSACEKKPEINSGKIEDYFATKANTIYVYDGPEETASAWNIHNDYIRDGFIQRKIIAGPYYAGELLSFIDGEMRVAYSQNNYFYMDDFGKYENNYNALILKEPLEKGNKWQLDSGISGAVNAEITNMDADVTVPYGTFKAMEVTITYEKSSSFQKEYYVKGIGLVKAETVKENGESFASELKEIKEASNFSSEITFYYPDANSEELGFEQRNIAFATNMDMDKYFEDSFKSYEEGHMPVFSENVKINSIRLDWSKALTSIDLSQDFIDQVNSNPELETKTLQSLMRTLREFYATDNLEVKIDGKNYESNNISFGDGEYINGDFGGIIFE